MLQLIEPGTKVKVECEILTAKVYRNGSIHYLCAFGKGSDKHEVEVPAELVEWKE